MIGFWLTQLQQTEAGGSGASFPKDPMAAMADDWWQTLYQATVEPPAQVIFAAAEGALTV